LAALQWERLPQLLKAADSKAARVLLPDVNHVLKSVATDDRAANLVTYGDPNLPIAPGIADAVAQFLLAGSTPR
jgi:uncharacterized protein